MADSLREQLLKSGIVKQVRDEKRRDAPRDDKRRRPPEQEDRPRHARPVRRDGKSRSSEEMDLARAYALRAQTEAAERKRAQAEAAAQAQARKERKRKLDEALRDRRLNKADADLVRHFEYAGKIRRVHVDAAQLAALNAGELGVVQHGGRYLLVARAVAEQVRGFAPEQVALLVDPGATVAEDDVPDDLVW
jgi:uncharacterized protein YaiL (DUF2058 family)